MNNAAVMEAPTAVSTRVSPSNSSASDLAAATRPFASEIRWKSWWHVGSTLGVITGVLACAALAPWWPLQLALSLLGALVMVRGFILFHDFAHGAILRKSKFARVLLSAYSMIFMAGVSYWREAHNFHHANCCDRRATWQGDFPVWTLEQWQGATRLQRLYYRVNRNPVTILLAYITVFFFANTLEPFLRHPLKHWTSGASILLHVGLIAGLWWLGGFWVAFFGFWMPYSLAAILGAYLFYAQHNFPGMEVLPTSEWNRTEAALRCTSHMRMSRFMHWCTGQIGFHHVHHMNSAIPFYRLKDAMAAIPALQSPRETTLLPWDIWRCLRLKLWDDAGRRMVTWRQARAILAAQPG